MLLSLFLNPFYNVNNNFAFNESKKNSILHIWKWYNFSLQSFVALDTLITPMVIFFIGYNYKEWLSIDSYVLIRDHLIRLAVIYTEYLFLNATPFYPR